MTDLSAFSGNMDWWGLVGLLVSAAAALFCITFHELSHGYVACRLGDPTAKNAGRLTLNPIAHIDWLGLAMLLVAKVGWAKPVPVDMRYFKTPKRGMALTALAGPASNFVLALAALGVNSLIFNLFTLSKGALVVMCLLSNIAILSVGLGIFNLIPIPPLDGSKVLFSLLPDKAYRTVLRYERYIMFLVIVLTMAGVLSRPLSWAIFKVMQGMCALVRYPLDVVYLTMDISYLMRVLGR